eukprot:12049437-Alexandrium_andersonii.AAC.1
MWHQTRPRWPQRRHIPRAKRPSSRLAIGKVGGPNPPVRGTRNPALLAALLAPGWKIRLPPSLFVLWRWMAGLLHRLE